MSRPTTTRKALYVAQGPQEEFIVPLLKGAIEKQIDRLLVARQDSAPARVLDAGCGGQPFRGRIEAAGAIYRSLDASAQEGVNIDFIAAVDENPLPQSVYEQGLYDVVLCSEVLEHVAEWDAAFANFNRLLAPLGHLIITCPHFFPLHEEPYDFWRPTPYALRFFAEKHGFRVEHEERLGCAWDVLGTLLARQQFRAVSRSFAHRVASRLCVIASSLSFKLLRSGLIQRAVTDVGPYYLANLHILQKCHAVPSP